ncbi:hypothetical protein [Candidatus Pelagibacter ubique]|uniref:hypothetical protein n=1 Tax=Pelagibacter ubique TaxID=198252 RepID=UPI0003C7E2E3
MIETLSIILHFLVITIFCYAPSFVCSFIKGEKNLDIINRLEVGLVFNLFLLLILSFILRSGSNFIYYFLIMIFLINLLFLLKDLFVNYKFKLLKINYIFFLLFLLFFIFSIDLSNNLKLGWDAQNYWLAKKLVFTNGGDFFDLKNTPRDDYPYLGSFLWHIYSKLSLLGYEYFGRLFYLFLFLLSIFSIASIIKVNTFEKIILIFVLIFLIYKVELFNGYQEILNFSLLILLTKIFYEILTEKIPIKQFDNKFIYLFILINSIIWIKSESTVLIIIFLFSLILVKEINFKIKILMTLVFIFLLLNKFYIFGFLDLSHEIQKGNYEYFKISNFFDFINFPRAILTLKYIFFYSLDNLILPVSIISSVVMLKYDKKNIFILPFSFMLVLGFGFFMAAFLLTSFPLEWVLWVSLSRIIFETSGLYIILIPLFYDFLKRKKFFNKV